MSYFTEIPVTLYPSLAVDATASQYVKLTNILTRSAFMREILSNASLFYEYQVKDGETPEIIADKLYGDVGRFWIVLLFNNLSNPYYDFPLVQSQLNDLITSKYDMTLEDSQSTIHHYEERITRTVLFNGMVQSQNVETLIISSEYADPTTGVATTRPSLPSVDSCISTGSTTTETFTNGITVVTSSQICAVSNYTYEFEQNEARRSIRLLDKRYVGTVEAELRRLMRNGT